MFEILAKLLSVMDNNWKGKIIGATSDGAASMMGRYEGSVTYIQKEARPGFVQSVVRLTPIGYCCPENCYKVL